MQNTRGDVESLLSRDPASLNKDERALLSLHQKTATYIGLMRSLSLILPLNVDVPPRYGDFSDQENIAYLDLARFDARIMNDLQSIIQRKGEDIGRYTDAEKQTALLGYDLQSIRAGGAMNDGLKIMPLKWDDARAQEFQSPWQLILSGQGSPENAQYLSLWRDMAQDYRATDHRAWSETSPATLAHIKERLGSAYPQTKFTLERIYHNIQPYSIAAFFYAAALLLLLIYTLRNISGASVMAKYALLGGTLFHAAAIGLRVLILDRPPVGTLYESVLFVALICAALGVILSRKNVNALYIFCGSFAALLLLLIAPFITTESQTLGVLSAVLNTNFWLATHVLCITIGYGVAVMTALCAHGYLIAKAAPKLLPKISADALLQITYRFSLAALLFTAVGTILGGIWADQSWGRFWGWDPKENGALLIVLWIIWLQHGRLSAHVNAVQFAAGMAALNIIVALAWFGVNLLSVGLHSYGFTAGLAWGLAVFCAVQGAMIALLWFFAARKEAANET